MAGVINYRYSIFRPQRSPVWSNALSVDIRIAVSNITPTHIRSTGIITCYLGDHVETAVDARVTHGDTICPPLTVHKGGEKRKKSDGAQGSKKNERLAFSIPHKLSKSKEHSAFLGCSALYKKSQPFVAQSQDTS
ncbi:MAG: hypothetical protein WEF53_06125 [Bacteroidota bacterium]